MIFADFTSAHGYTLCILYVIHLVGMSILLSKFNPSTVSAVMCSLTFGFISPNSYFRHYLSDIGNMLCHIRLRL